MTMRMIMRPQLLTPLLLIVSYSHAWVVVPPSRTTTTFSSSSSSTTTSSSTLLRGWVQGDDGEWEWAEDDPNYNENNSIKNNAAATSTATVIEASATPQLPSGSYKPKQSLGQNYLKDPNTVAKIIRTFHRDAIVPNENNNNARIVELGPGAGALTDKLVETYGATHLQCIEIDDRSVALLRDKHPGLDVLHADVLQVDYPKLAKEQSSQQEQQEQQQQPLTIIGNLPYYITSQILFSLADASHVGAVQSATVTMQWEVAQRLVAQPCTKEYGILSVVFQLYCRRVQCHFKIPPTVFYPQPKVDSALVGLHFWNPHELRQTALRGVDPAQLRRIVTTAFQQRRKTLRNSLKRLVKDEYNNQNRNPNGEEDDEFVFDWQQQSPAKVSQSIEDSDDSDDTVDDSSSTSLLPPNWSSKRAEELTPAQFVELTRLIYGDHQHDNGGDNEDEEDEFYPLGVKVWRKLKHGKSN